MLEEQTEKLESEKAQLDAINSKLLEEMEKRDKAIEEAVAMIVMLEASVNELTKERTMVRQVEAQGFYNTPSYQPRVEQPPSEVNSVHTAHLDDARSLNRMPSFLSDRSDKTENLRNVYLGRRGSVLSLSRVAEGSSEADNGHYNGLSSPTLSVLSESSFVSVYGQKEQEEMESSETLSLDTGNIGPGHAKAPIHKPDALTPTRRSISFSRATTSGQFEPIASIIEGSPLQRIERLDPGYSPRRETLQPASSRKSLSAAESSNPSKSPRKLTREEKRDALRKVMTDTPGGVSLNEQALPPTPDTVGSSTLRRFKNSNDTLDRRHDGLEGRSQDNLPHVSNSHEKLSDPLPIVPMGPKTRLVQTTKNAEEPNNPSRRGLQPQQRPRSADESTVSHIRGSSWDLDGEDSDADSLASSLDIWLQAGSKSPRSGRASPDMFGFPTNPTSGSWSMNAMFGSHNAHSGGASINPDSDQMHDLFSAQQALFGGPPPTPNRRSSLNAQTGPNAPPADDGTPKVPAKAKKQKLPRRRHLRRNSDDAQMRANMKTPVPGQLAQPPPQPSSGEQKRNHYPPIVGQQGARASLGRFFRRSLGGTPLNDVGPPTNAEPAKADPPKNVQQLGAAPTWVSRSSAVEDDRTGATPPPILRNPRKSRGNSVSQVEAQGPRTSGMDGVPTRPATALAMKTNEQSPTKQEQPQSGPAAGSATGARRKWLPAFGRSSSLRNRNG